MARERVERAGALRGGQHDLVGQHLDEDLVGRVIAPQADHQEDGALQRTGEEEGSVGNRRALAEEGHVRHACVVADPDTIGKHADELAALQTRPDVEDAVRRGTLEIDDAQALRRIQTGEDRVDHPCVAQEHGDVERDPALVRHQTERVEAAEMGADHEGAAPPLGQPLQVLAAVHHRLELTGVAEKERGAVDHVQRELVKVAERLAPPRRAWHRVVPFAGRPAVQACEIVA